MTTAWAHLPNAAHIDRIIASAKDHPEAWAEAWAAVRDHELTAAWYAARRAAREAARDRARGPAEYAAGCAVGAAAWLKRDAAGDAAWDAVLALIAWDHSANFLDMTADELKMWRVLSEDPSAILLLPAVMAFERIAELVDG